MKPASIRKFDMLYWAAVAVGLLGGLLTWNDNVALVEQEMATAGFSMDGVGTGTLIAGVLFGLAINAALWALISILRIGFVKWIILAFTLYGIFTLVVSPVAVPMVTLVSSVVSNLLMFAALYFLWQPDAKAWLAEKRPRR